MRNRRSQGDHRGQAEPAPADTGALPDPRVPGLWPRPSPADLLVQSRDNGMVEDLELKVVTKARADGAGTRST
jgi:hypothetical protein